MTTFGDTPEAGADINIVLGDSYLVADGTSFLFNEDPAHPWPLNITSATVSLKIGTFTKTGVVTSTVSPQVLHFDLAATDTVVANLPLTTYRYQVYAVVGAVHHTLVTGTAHIRSY